MSLLPLKLLRAGASELGVELTEHQLEQCDAFARLLLEANLKFNLTRITQPEAIVVNHFLDSLTCLWALEFKAGARVIDVGTGAGFPGIPIKIARPDLSLTLLDATRK
ncbi:MAG: 16S rRNA (guanine(527)-N(7))-methyltransferase RsmG, partial [Armatimonadota bacterium]